MAVLVLLLSCSVVPNSVTMWTVAYQAPVTMGFSRPEYWSGVPFPTPGDIPNPGIEPTFLASPALAAVFQSLSCVQLCDLMDCMYSLPGSSVHGDFPGSNTGVGCYALLQGTFSTQGLLLEKYKSKLQ